jgi:cytochrome c oxidase subunit 3
MAAIEIPYNSNNHPDTGVYNAKLGIWLFIASEVLFFGALFSTYILLRVGAGGVAGNWPVGADLLNVPLATFNTVVLISSSMTMVMSWASLKMGRFDAFKRYFGATIALALVFLLVKGLEYYAEIFHQRVPSTSTFLATYYTMTGIHALHIIFGVVVNAYHYVSAKRLFETEPERFTNRIEVAGLYWHFVDLVWIFLFPVLYLL